MNGHIGLIHSILPATVDLHVTIPDSHPSTRNLGSERVGSGTIVDPGEIVLAPSYRLGGYVGRRAVLPSAWDHFAKVQKHRDSKKMAEPAGSHSRPPTRGDKWTGCPLQILRPQR